MAARQLCCSGPLSARLGWPDATSRSRQSRTVFRHKSGRPLGGHSSFTRRVSSAFISSSRQSSQPTSRDTLRVGAGISSGTILGRFTHEDLKAKELAVRCRLSTGPKRILLSGCRSSLWRLDCSKTRGEEWRDAQHSVVL